jgi:hypothetical protein
LDTILDLGEELLLKGLAFRHDLFGVGVLRLEIRQHFRVRPLAEPVVVIDPQVAVHLELVSFLLGDRRHGFARGASDHRCGDARHSQNTS